MNTLTREEVIDILIGNEIFDEENINNHEKATEFYRFAEGEIWLVVSFLY